MIVQTDEISIADLKHLGNNLLPAMMEELGYCRVNNSTSAELQEEG